MIDAAWNRGNFTSPTVRGQRSHTPISLAHNISEAHGVTNVHLPIALAALLCTTQLSATTRSPFLPIELLWRGVATKAVCKA
jgi:hypothetical protein